VARGPGSDAQKPRRLTQNAANDTNPRWAPDGASIYFLSARGGSMQIWRLPMLGGEAVQITDYPLDVGTFRFSPDGGRLASRMEVFRDCPDLKCTRERLDCAGANKARRAPTTALFVRHWDTWRDQRDRTCSWHRYLPTAAPELRST
jgi:dipeptidyl aminopeptidase/acylaminoacyl peptidase